MAEIHNILLIDDEADFCYFIKKNLENSGKFIVITASDPQEGIELAKNMNPD